jgi:hypothetical protein
MVVDLLWLQGGVQIALDEKRNVYVEHVPTSATKERR